MVSLSLRLQTIEKFSLFGDMPALGIAIVARHSVFGMGPQIT